MRLERVITLTLVGVLALGAARTTFAQRAVGAQRAAGGPAAVLSVAEWERVDRAVEKALEWLASQQDADGSFPTIPTGQPAVTSLSMMAFVAHGNTPGEGRYGANLERATDYVASCQKQNGLVALVAPDGPTIDRNVEEHEIGTCAAYNHAISSLMLSEVYGMSSPERARRIEAVVERSVATSLTMQRWSKDRAVDRGGWRYIDDIDSVDSDLSVTGWELMFLRSARNAGFDVPKEPIDEAVAYIRRCYSSDYGAFQYMIENSDHRSRCMAGAGILALAHAGYHDSMEAQQSGRWLLEHNFVDYNVSLPFTQTWVHDRYHYGLFNCCQGMYQLGGKYWEAFFPATVRTLLENQQADGSWPVDSHWHDSQFGSAYTTALVVMTLGAPNQLLPVFQR
jgi:hypothetical protein